MSLQDLSEIIKLPQRKLIVSSNDIDLTFSSNKETTNTIFVLMIKESRGSAGGRGGGSGMRKIEKILAFDVEKDGDKLIYETSAEAEIEKFEIPYSAVALDIVLRSGEKYVVQGIVDPQMVIDYLRLIKKI
ncbi:hypothetical protein [Candidatus Nitrosocosmicus franklandus]|uniref:Uncharacterized protein n=1 Tax=Candidatus Nitrosocosmicus franklandianus TaxID=1798806 RepID=A0A484IEB8_9ARCH|nr:hypothetical protein [Candidatus Nitrosocosmicus franklandus]VFJ15088.1 conserved protein of unknown function [Candidatus Nitrosocosmicus franklandus]